MKKIKVGSEEGQEGASPVFETAGSEHYRPSKGLRPWDQDKSSVM